MTEPTELLNFYDVWDQETKRLNENVRQAISQGQALKALKMNSPEDFVAGDSVRVGRILLRIGYESEQRSFISQPTSDTFSDMMEVLEQIRRELQDRLNLDELDDRGNSLLHLSIDHMMPACVQILLQHRANPYVKSRGRQGVQETPWERLSRYLKESSISPGHYRFMYALLDYHTLVSLGINDRSVFGYSTSRWYSGIGLLELKNFGPSETQEPGYFKPKGEPAWVHLPRTSAPGVLFIAAAVDRNIAQRNGQSWCDRASKFTIRSFTNPAIAPRDPLLNYRDPGYIVSDDKDPRADCALVFPCLILCTRRTWENRRLEHRKIRNAMFHVPGESQMLAAENSRTEVYLERTLDEAYYPGLDEIYLRERNEDQVVESQFKREEKRQERNPNSDLSPIVLAPQLWLWKIDNILISAYSMTPSNDFLEDILEGSGLEEYHKSSYKAEMLIAYTLRYYIDDFGRENKDPITQTVFPPALDYFETALVAILSEVQDYAITGKSHGFDVKHEGDFLHRISDIQNELDIIRTIIGQQEEVLREFRNDKGRRREEQERKRKREEMENEPKIVGGNAYASQKVIARIELIDAELSNLYSLLDQAERRLASYTKRIDKIDRDAGRIAKNIDDMLNLRRVQASIEEAKVAVWIGWMAAAFALVSVVFTPLSFVVSLMALPIENFVDLQHKYQGIESESRVYSFKNVSAVLGKAEAATLVTLAVPALIAVSIYNRLKLQAMWTEWLQRKQKISQSKQEKNESKQDLEAGQSDPQPEILQETNKDE